MWGSPHQVSKIKPEIFEVGIIEEGEEEKYIKAVWNFCREIREEV